MEAEVHIQFVCINVCIHVHGLFKSITFYPLLSWMGKKKGERNGWECKIYPGRMMVWLAGLETAKMFWTQWQTSGLGNCVVASMNSAIMNINQGRKRKLKTQ